MAAIPTTSPNPSLDSISRGELSGVLNNGTHGFPRLEIDDFCQDNDRLNLYLLALEAVQNNDHFNTAPWSWFQIQGIHGQPDIGWDGIGPNALYDWMITNGTYAQARDYSRANLVAKNIPSAKWSQLNKEAIARPRTGDLNRGFCNHGSVLFPSWHRAYGAMMEQAIQAQMVQLADQFVPLGGPRWRAARLAAQSFRQPYWDFLRARTGTTAKNDLIPGLSYILAVKNVRVRRPGNPEQLVTIPNPLYSYRFPGLQAMTAAGVVDARGEWAGFPAALTSTYRHPPLGFNPVSAPSDNLDVQRTFVPGFQLQALQDKVYNVLTRPQSYRAFSTNSYPQGEALAKGDATSAELDVQYAIESWHNNLHVILGGPPGPSGSRGRAGSMTFPSSAGFDPIFLLHHANVDRHYALWQASFPDAWWLPGEMAAFQNSFTTKTGTIETPTTPLLPFRKPKPPTSAASQVYWNTNDLRSVRTLGYQYDPIPSTASRQARTDAALEEINKRYAWYKTRPDIKDARSLDPVPMDKVEAFTEYPPLIDGNTSQVNFFSPDSPVPSPSPPQPLFLMATPSTASSGLEAAAHKASSDSSPRTSFRYIFPPNEISADNSIHAWTVHIRALRHGLATSFTIFIFLGDFPTSPSQWPNSPHLVAALHQFVNHNPAAFQEQAFDSDAPLELRDDRMMHPTCANCALQEISGVMVSDWTPLTSALLHYISTGEAEPESPPTTELPGVPLESLSEIDVVPFLKRNLHWRILRSDGMEVPRNELPEFRVFVSQQNIKLPRRNSDAPVYGPETIVWEVTNSRPGGLATGEIP